MIVRPLGLKIIEVEFNLTKLTSLEIDLNHINKNNRSSFNVTKVVSIVRNFIEGAVLHSSGEKEFGEEFCSYFIKMGIIDKKKYKLAFCVCSDRPNSIGIITLHRVGESL